MSQYNDTNVLTVLTAEAVSIHQLIELDSNREANVMDSTGYCLGAARATAAAGEPVGVTLMSKTGTMKMIADGAITCGVVVYAAAAGECGAAGTVEVGVALETAAAQGDVIEVLPIN